MKTTTPLLLLLFVLFATSATQLSAQQYPEVTIPGSQIRKITSKVVTGQEYELHIQLPANYDGNAKKYPVVYVMDSQWDFPLVSAIYGEQYYDGFIPELIIVGVTWADRKVLRSRDYTPTHVGQGDSGGADKFLDFMKTELFPFIENNYRVDSSNRTVMGCSLGGLFTLYALFTHTDMFTGYIAASPAIGWDNGLLNKYEKAFSEKKITQPVRVYMTVGDVEQGRPFFEQFAEKMKSSNYMNVRLHSKVLENTGHSGTKSETYTRGLQFVFERNQLSLNDKALAKYVGTYHIEDNSWKAEIKNEYGQLKLYFFNSQLPLYADSPEHFYATSSFFNLYFKENNGAVEGFMLVTYDRMAKLIKD